MRNVLQEAIIQFLRGPTIDFDLFKEEKMTTLTLQRFYMDEDVTLGCIALNRIPLYTLEDPWLDNEKDKSCIPTGSYQCVRYPSSKFGEVYLLQNVPDRDGILIHPGNTPKDTEGCILLGMCANAKELEESRMARHQLEEEMRHRPFQLIVRNPHGK